MARDFDGSTDYMTTTTMPSISALPFTICGWFQVDTAQNQRWFTYGDNSTLDNSFLLGADVSGGNYKPYLSCNGVQAKVAGAQSVSETTWHFAIGGCASGGGFWFDWDNGSATATGTGGAFPSTFDVSTIGVRHTFKTALFLAGRAAELALWDVDFTATGPEIAQLNSGVSPAMVRPGALVAYVPLVHNTTSATRDYVTGASYTTGLSSPAAADHVPITYPAMRHIITAPSAAPAGTVGRTNPFIGRSPFRGAI